MMTLRTRSHGACVLALLAFSGSAAGLCTQSTFQPQWPGIPLHDAYALTDPSGQQTARFDLVWGGSLASLTYDPPGAEPVTELVWGHANGGLVQPAWFGCPVSNPPTPCGAPFFYNPGQGGTNPTHGTPVAGVRCLDSNTVLITSIAADYMFGGHTYIVGHPVINHGIDQNRFSTPYTIATLATFVANTPGQAPPDYYLRVTQTIINNHRSEFQTFKTGIATYVPVSFEFAAAHPPECRNDMPDESPLCPIAQNPKMIGGLYLDSGLLTGLASYMRPGQWRGALEGWIDMNHEPGPPNRSIYNDARVWNLPPGTAQTYEFYLLAGPWAKAKAFALAQP